MTTASPPPAFEAGGHSFTSVSSPCYCADARDESSCCCWVVGYHYTRVVREAHAAAGAPRYDPRYGPPPPGAWGAGAPAVAVAARTATETACILGPVGYMAGTDECAACASTRSGCARDCLLCGIDCLSGPLGCLVCLLCGQDAVAAMVRENRAALAAASAPKRPTPYECGWLAPLACFKRRKAFVNPGQPPVSKLEVCSVVFCAREE